MSICSAREAYLSLPLNMHEREAILKFWYQPTAKVKVLLSSEKLSHEVSSSAGNCPLVAHSAKQGRKRHSLLAPWPAQKRAGTL